MAKQGMKRISRTHTKPRNDAPPVPEIQGKAKLSNAKANPVVDGAMERSISSVYPVIDTDLARDNVENDLSAADLQDL